MNNEVQTRCEHNRVAYVAACGPHNPATCFCMDCQQDVPLSYWDKKKHKLAPCETCGGVEDCTPDCPSRLTNINGD